MLQSCSFDAVSTEIDSQAGQIIEQFYAIRQRVDEQMLDSCRDYVLSLK